MCAITRAIAAGEGRRGVGTPNFPTSLSTSSKAGRLGLATVNVLWQVLANGMGRIWEAGENSIVLRQYHLGYLNIF
jgi:hypothetical protein